MVRLTRTVLVGTALAWLACAGDAAAGPPYATDDPEPVEYRHWEFYVASQSAKAEGTVSLTAPHFEVNYGILPDLQLHAIVPLTLVVPKVGSSQYGYGDTEFGSKFRFVHEGDYAPQIGVFPLLEIPTGSASRGLGNGKAQLYLPLWLQKSFGPWTSYGGAGYWLHPGAGNANYLFLGWQVQRRLADPLTLGVELFHTTRQVTGGTSETRFNVGAVIDLSDVHHVLLSAGRALFGPTIFQSYLAYQITVGSDAP